MEHAGVGVFAWEFWNEPDLDYMYLGTPEQYGRALGAIYRLSAGRFRILNGGVASLGSGLPFLQRAIEAGARFDIANIHLRGSHLRARARAATRFSARDRSGSPSTATRRGRTREISCAI
jgi:hypothetical protein